MKIERNKPMKTVYIVVEAWFEGKMKPSYNYFNNNNMIIAGNDGIYLDKKTAEKHCSYMNNGVECEKKQYDFLKQNIVMPFYVNSEQYEQIVNYLSDPMLSDPTTYIFAKYGDKIKNKMSKNAA